jgi:hypothetical protein
VVLDSEKVMEALFEGMDAAARVALQLLITSAKAISTGASGIEANVSFLLDYLAVSTPPGGRE